VKLVLEVAEGPDRGRRFEFSEPDCFLVGRDAPGSCAHYRLGPEDVYVSRNHFLLEIRPPRCHVRDNQSKNGTWLRRAGGEWRRIEAEEVRDGDEIRVGKTVLRLSFVEEPEEERYFCVRCGADITPLLAGRKAAGLAPGDFLCPDCREKARPREKGPAAPGCSICGGRLEAADPRFDELKEACLYLCAHCAERERAEGRPDFGDYTLLKELGRGGFGSVFQAWHRPTGRLVALKRMVPELGLDERKNKLFQREIAVMGELVHPHIVRLFDHGMVGREHWFAAEFAPGGDLWTLVRERRRGPLPAEEACRYVCQALDGLEYAHRKGFVHRDLKPQNILLGGRGPQHVAKIGDFGLAKCYETAGMSRITKTGEVEGTPFFIAPEQLENYKYVKPPADVYSMGVTLYFLLTGKFPFEFPSSMEQLRDLLLKGKRPKDPIRLTLEEERIPIREQNPSVPRRLAEVVDRSVRRREEERFRSAGEFKQAIEAALK
jgi:serine/threonine-protein kinase